MTGINKTGKNNNGKSQKAQVKMYRELVEYLEKEAQKKGITIQKLILIGEGCRKHYERNGGENSDDEPKGSIRLPYFGKFIQKGRLRQSEIRLVIED